VELMSEKLKHRFTFIPNVPSGWEMWALDKQVNVQIIWRDMLFSFKGWIYFCRYTFRLWAAHLYPCTLAVTQKNMPPLPYISWYPYSIGLSVNFGGFQRRLVIALASRQDPQKGLFKLSKSNKASGNQTYHPERSRVTSIKKLPFDCLLSHGVFNLMLMI
jgi:hypothetical protein